MAEVTTVRVVRRRSVQPEQYGNAAAEVEFVGNVQEGEDYQAVARELLVASRALVYENLGLRLPKHAVDEAAEKDTPQETAKVEVKTEAGKKASVVPDDETATEADTEEKPKRRGRPPGSKNTAPKKNSKAAKEAAKEAAKSKGSDVPDDDDDIPNIRANPEDRKNPDDEKKSNASSTSVPEESDDDMTVEYTASDLHQDIVKAAKDKKISVQQGKQLLASFKVARPQDLSPEQVQKCRKMLADLLKTKGD